MNTSQLRDHREEDLHRENHSQRSIDPNLRHDDWQDHSRSSYPLTRSGSSMDNLQASATYLHDYSRTNNANLYFESQQYGGTGA
ncbi:hypothetical protein PM082_007377 [Marasmius tenuissimus]|nr:hypothetical protein PM082_007377 [Marasmius tenuissimus]